MRDAIVVENEIIVQVTYTVSSGPPILTKVLPNIKKFVFVWEEYFNTEAVSAINLDLYPPKI